MYVKVQSLTNHTAMLRKPLIPIAWGDRARAGRSVVLDLGVPVRRIITRKTVQDHEVPSVMNEVGLRSLPVLEVVESSRVESSNYISHASETAPSRLPFGGYEFKTGLSLTPLLGLTVLPVRSLRWHSVPGSEIPRHGAP
jgi:hypothetical protein